MSENAQLDNYIDGPAGPKQPSPDRDSEEQEGADSDEYGTPRWLIRRLTQHGLFDLDPAAGAEPIPIAHRRFTIEDDGLARSWAGVNVPEAASTHEHKCSLRCVSESSSQSPTTNEETIPAERNSRYETDSMTRSTNESP